MKNNTKKIRVIRCQNCGIPVFDWSKHLFCDEVDVAEHNLKTPRGIRIQKWFNSGMRTD